MNKKFFIISVAAIALILFALFSTQNFFSSNESDLKLTGTPADNFSEDQRPKFCGTENATSTNYVKEYKIPTDCTMPQSIISDHDGNIWFVESNTGSLAKFDPIIKSFKEYKNPFWPKTKHSMMWGIDYSPDQTILFTDEKYKSVWKFNIVDEKYQIIPFPSTDNSFPQRLKIQGSKLIVNDFKGNKIVFLDYAQSDTRLPSYSLPSNNPNAVTADFVIDGENLWYTNWVLNGTGILTKLNQTELDLAMQNDRASIQMKSFPLPSDLKTPNGITADHNGTIWIADSSNSLFFKFNPLDNNFTKYMTPDPQKSTYGNYTGEIRSPVSRPYWIDVNSFGKLVFNEQGSNKIGVFEPNSESLVEYSIPSQNPNWGDCGNVQNCGISQIFDFTIKNDQIWFTEWAENNIGVVDTTVPLPFEVNLDNDTIIIHPGESNKMNFTISSTDIQPVSLILSDSSEFLDLQTNSPHDIFLSNSESINVTINADDKIIPGKYKILLGVENQQVSISKFVTVIVE